MRFALHGQVRPESRASRAQEDKNVLTVLYRILYTMRIEQKARTHFLIRFRQDGKALVRPDEVRL